MQWASAASSPGNPADDRALREGSCPSQAARRARIRRIAPKAAAQPAGTGQPLDDHSIFADFPLIRCFPAFNDPS
jgi:hypothetical protein